MKHYFSLFIWITAFILIGALIGFVTQAGHDLWYTSLKRSALTPPAYVFPIVWTILYTLLACCAWLIWRLPAQKHTKLLKRLYWLQMLLNWSWSPLFFGYHLPYLSLIALLIMDGLSIMIILLSINVRKIIAYLMLIYFLWIVLASYLNAYICLHLQA